LPGPRPLRGHRARQPGHSEASSAFASVATAALRTIAPSMTARIARAGRYSRRFSLA
jgi:hypothetical protein